jgi:hypothetical protein
MQIEPGDTDDVADSCCHLAANVCAVDGRHRNVKPLQNKPSMARRTS